MAELTATLFGTPSVCVDGRRISLPYKKADALLYYLILRRRATRSELIGLLWADADTPSALKNLRHAIYSIRKELGFDPFLDGRRSALEFSPEVRLQCDVLDFLEKGDLGAYRGELLQDFGIHRAGAFDEWLSDQRNLLQTQYLQRLLAAEKEAYFRGDLDRAEQYGLDYLALDPLEESTVLTLMQIYAAQKKFRKAIGLYHTLCKNLSDELSISPLKETTALYYKIVDEWNASTYRIEKQDSHRLLGKDPALRKLLTLCNGSRAEHKKPCILIQGKAGVGKTYLLDYVLRQYDFSDWLVCRASCYQTEMRTALAPWNSVMLELTTEIKPRHIQIPDAYLKTAACLFPCLSLEYWRDYADTVGDFPAKADYHVALESALLVFSVAAKKLPLLLVFEDIHWMDPASADMLMLFLRRLCSLDVTVVCTGRDILPPHIQQTVEDAQRDKLLEACSLHDFTREETADFVRHYLPRQCDGDAIERIYRNTEGNGLLLVQLLNSIRETGEPGEFPDDPERIIGYRLSNLTADETGVLNAISVFTDWAPFDILTSILTKDALELMYLCDQLQQKALLAESTRNGALGYSFAHERIKAILARQQSESGRRILHLRVAQYLETQLDGGDTRPYSRLVQHYTAGGDRYNAFKYKVLSLGAFAGMCYELLPVLTADAEALSMDDGGLMGYFQVLERELAALRATRFGGDGRELDQLERDFLYAESRYCIHNGIYDKGLELLERLLRSSEAAGDWEMSVKAHLQMVYFAVQTYDMAVMEEHLRLGMAYRAQMERTPEWGAYLRLNGLLNLMRGNYRACRAWMERSIAAFEALDPGPGGQYVINIAGAYNYIAETYRLEGSFQEAFAYYDRAIVYNKSRGGYPGAAIFYTDYGVAAYQSGEREEARRLFEYAEEIYQSFHEYSQFPIALSYLALYNAEEGRCDEAAARLKKALDICQQIGSPWWMGITVYMSWKIRGLLEQTGAAAPELEALWPASKREHCLWGLRYLRRLEPRLETREMEEALRALP